MTDRVREKLSQLRTEADTAITRAETAEAKIKALEQALLDKDHEIKSLQVRLAQADGALEKAEDAVHDSKAAQQEAEAGRATIEGLTRKITLLEDELDGGAEQLLFCRLRQVDVKAEHFERQVHVIEQERDQWEKKCEAAEKKYRDAKAELDELVATMEGL
ncbi:tropomyosin [Mycena epipterygia]|nr:tropomyosin [Mycena epipterygia]